MSDGMLIIGLTGGLTCGDPGSKHVFMYMRRAWPNAVLHICWTVISNVSTWTYGKSFEGFFNCPHGPTEYIFEGLF